MMYGRRLRVVPIFPHELGRISLLPIGLDSLIIICSFAG